MRKSTGISLMLLIFLTLSLVTFSLLSLSGAKADERLSQEAAERTQSYYQAETRAYQILSVIDDLLAGFLIECENSDQPAENWSSLCADLPERFSEIWSSAEANLETWYSEDAFSDEVPELSWDADAEILSFDTPITETQVLHAELLLSGPSSEEDTMYTITAWQTVNTKEWNADRSLDVYQRLS